MEIARRLWAERNGMRHTEEKKHINVACIGNPNCGKTTLFNALTGSRLKVANWPGVTVERFEGETSYEDVEITAPRRMAWRLS